jgi:hypothetical protein
MIEAVARELRRAPVRLGADLDERVMRAVRGGAPPRGALARGWAWLRAPRPVALSPIGWLAMAAGLVMAAVVGAGLRPTRGESPVAAAPVPAAPAAADSQGAPGIAAFAGGAEPAAAAAATAVLPDATEDGRRWVRFALVAPAPAARSVAVVGDFNDWSAEATPLRYSPGEGVWSVELPLSAGRHEYTFLVNGATFIADPSAPASTDDFGAPNSVVTVPEPSS